MQASGAMALLTLDIAYGVLAASIVLGDIGVALRTLLSPDSGGTLDLNVLTEILLRFLCVLGLGPAWKRRKEK